jgi:hypothetical protein
MYSVQSSQAQASESTRVAHRSERGRRQVNEYDKKAKLSEIEGHPRDEAFRTAQQSGT